MKNLSNYTAGNALKQFTECGDKFLNTFFLLPFEFAPL